MASKKKHPKAPTPKHIAQRYARGAYTKTIVRLREQLDRANVPHQIPDPLPGEKVEV